MEKKTFIFVGKSGCGKGTQAELLINELKAKDPTREVFHLESGERFRQFIGAGESYASQLSRKLNEAGDLQPEFLAVWVWSDLLIKNIAKDEHLVIDGTPRKLHEAPILEGALHFFERVNPYVIHINVSDTWATKRMLDRQRGDDGIKSIEKRLAWYKTDVEPVVEYYKTHPYTFIEVNGEQTIEAVHNDIMSKIDLHD